MPKKLVFLKTQSDFSNFKKSRSLVSANLKVRWQQSPNQNFPRFGFIIPKRVVSLVTKRNVIKRRVKTILSKHLQKIRPFDILFFPKPGTIKLKFPDLEQELIEVLKKARIYGDDK